jgi:hypothetical protein
MLVDQVRQLSAPERLLYFVRERESVRIKKESGEPPPWTDDEVLQRYRFTCVRRMDDKVSRWLLDNWYRPYFGHPNMLAAAALARFVNRPETLEKVGFPGEWEPTKIKRVLRRIKARGGKVFNAAYMVRGNDGQDKAASVVDYYVGLLVKDPPPVDPSSMERTWATLVPRYGWGSFMAGQVVADLRHALPGAWADAGVWAPAGPGSVRGLHRLRGESPGKPMGQTEFLDGLLGVIEMYQKRLPPEIIGRLEAIDVQNTLCELSKYEKALWGQGRPKQTYLGGARDL